MSKSIKRKHFHLFIAAYYLILAVVLVFLLATKVVAQPNWFLGLIIVLSVIPEIALYFINYEYKLKRHIVSVILIVLTVILGICFIFSTTINTETICLVWGILDILRGVNQIVHASISIKKDKSLIIKALVNVLTVVVGILLCVRLKDGVTFHLTMLGLSIILLAIYETIQFKAVERGVDYEN